MVGLCRDVQAVAGVHRRLPQQGASREIHHQDVPSEHLRGWVSLNPKIYALRLKPYTLHPNPQTSTPNSQPPEKQQGIQPAERSMLKLRFAGPSASTFSRTSGVPSTTSLRSSPPSSLCSQTPTPIRRPTQVRRQPRTTPDFTRSNCEKQSRTSTTKFEVHVLKSPRLACIPPEIREIDFCNCPASTPG